MQNVNPHFQRMRPNLQPTTNPQTNPLGGSVPPTESLIQAGFQSPYQSDIETRQAMLEARQANLEAIQGGDREALVRAGLLGGFQSVSPAHQPQIFHPAFQTPVPQPTAQFPSVQPGIQPSPGTGTPQPSFGQPAAPGPFTGSWPTAQTMTGAGQQFPGHSPFAEPGQRPNVVRQPPCDVIDDGANLVLEFELPGVSKKDIELVGQGQGIALRAASKEDVAEENIISSERGRVQYRRQVPLGVPIVPDKIKAKFENGILKVTVPKKEPTSGPTRVEVQ